MQERKLSKKVEKIAKRLPDAEFKKRYGKDWMAVKIATAEKLAESENFDVIDTINMDVPLFLRALEYAKEDAQSDLDLHDFTEKAIALNKQKRSLTMDDYMSLIGKSKDQMNEAIDPVLLEKIVAALLMILGPTGIYVGMEKLRKITEKYVGPLLDKLYGKTGVGAKFIQTHIKTLYAAAQEGKDTLEQKLSDLISGLYEEKTKRDRCLRIADRKFDKPSAYKSGAVVRCRQGKIWKGIKEAYEQLDEKEKETLRTWFKRKGAPGKTGGWVDCNSPIRKDGEVVGYKPCGRQKGEKRAKYPSCRPTPAKCKDPGKGTKWGKTK
jgi:hypothetical protein